ncbi:hypothetical protein MMC09_005833 [Bachmanniomyces sp. S44760]|nr:hypothetical protein [Bachmanniomyces sp. S44760]
MPYLAQVLREALGSLGEHVRLGNVRCVSAKRGWWTREVKEDVWKRGGAGWLVGKVNVGKSSLFECIYPKGRTTQGILPSELESSSSPETKVSVNASDAPETNLTSTDQYRHDHIGNCLDIDELDRDIKHTLLPPAPREATFPLMPIVSSHPGTTASPIRVPFGSGKGELIDLPGLLRGNLEDFVAKEYKQNLVMRRRVWPEQFVIKPGQSLLVSGLIRITSTIPDVVLLACPFVPLDCHVTSTEKAIAIHLQEESSGVVNISKQGAGDAMVSAGVFALKWDVTKRRAGPLTASDAVGLKPQNLPFIVFSTDILIEGCGWIEITVQVRRKDYEEQGALHHENGNVSYPAVEVFSPEGRSIGARRPMNAWMLGDHKNASNGKSRPRKSMKGVKKSIKLARATNA